MTPPLKVARTLVSRTATGSKARRGVLGIHDIRLAFFHEPVEEEIYVRMTRKVCKPGHVALLRRALYGTRQASWLWQKTVVVPCTYLHEAWDNALTGDGDDFLSEVGYVGSYRARILGRVERRSGVGWAVHGADGNHWMSTLSSSKPRR